MFVSRDALSACAPSGAQNHPKGSTVAQQATLKTNHGDIVLNLFADSTAQGLDASLLLSLQRIRFGS